MANYTYRQITNSTEYEQYSQSRVLVHGFNISMDLLEVGAHCFSGGDTV